MFNFIFSKFGHLLILVGILSFTACKKNNPNYQADASDPSFLHQSTKKLTDIIVHDIFSPPVASRIYAYTQIAAYECAVHGDSTYLSMAGQLTDLEQVPQPDQGKEYCYPLAALRAHMTVGKAMIFSEDKLTEFEVGLLQKYKEINMPQDVYDRSIAYGIQMAEHILEWAKKDNYNQSRSFPKFSINDDPNRWKPTPPGYFDGIEPHWMKIRPFVIDSSNQFKPIPPTAFSIDTSSKFIEETMEVYRVVKNANQEQKDIASFWDCNPYVMNVTGHVMHASKKITPGGHWMGITGIACKTANADFVQSCAAYCLTSIALADGFISCWDEKYRSNLIRPETVINEYIDEDWIPLLQTPPFPEYTSGHSVISTAAAISLTSIFGDNFKYRDDVELEYGLMARSYNSFNEAAAEAAISRLYGGIHYRPAIDQGVIQGRAVGEYVVAQVKLKN